MNLTERHTRCSFCSVLLKYYFFCGFQQHGIQLFIMPEYFCTVGFGLGSFAVQELTDLSGVTVQQVLTGKVFFEKDSQPEELLKLKTAERLCVKLLHCESATADTNSIEDWLSTKLQSVLPELESKLHAWRALFSNQEEQIKFKVFPRLTGRFRQASHFHQVASLANTVLAQSPSLVADSHHPHLEVLLHLNDSYLTVGLPASKRPLSDRGYIQHIAVRSTVCCALCMAVGLTPQDVLLDPMCGAATILIEAVQQFHCKFALGIDSDPSQLGLAQSNLRASELSSGRIELVSGDARSASLLQGSFFDVVLCDVPFGRKFGRPHQIQALLASVVLTIDAALKPGGRVGILVR